MGMKSGQPLREFFFISRNHLKVHAKESYLYFLSRNSISCSIQALRSRKLKIRRSVISVISCVSIMLTVISKVPLNSFIFFFFQWATNGFGRGARSGTSPAWRVPVPPQDWSDEGRGICQKKEMDRAHSRNSQRNHQQYPKSIGHV